VFTGVLQLPFSRKLRSKRRSRSGVLRRISQLRARPWNVALLFAVVLGIVGYLALVNENATAGYELRTVEDRAKELRGETRGLERQVLETQTMERVTMLVKDMGYVPVESVQYIMPDRAVVLR
jgi:hypothetical protein